MCRSFVLLKMLPLLATSGCSIFPSVCIFCGKGNNGSDGYAAGDAAAQSR